jgi:hypothetical protein
LEPDKNAPLPLLYHLDFIVELAEGSSNMVSEPGGLEFES